MASDIIMRPTARVNSMIRTAVTLGSTCLIIILALVAPIDLEASK